ncbi:MAG TPA: hypothetical protein DEG55_02515 [Acidaminococcaceae bacterium]|nr:hypothetical protein [Acidaminococcaceae bacterium]
MIFIHYISILFFLQMVCLTLVFWLRLKTADSFDIVSNQDWPTIYSKTLKFLRLICVCFP